MRRPDCRGKAPDRWADRRVGKALKQTGRLALCGTLNGSLVGVPAYSLQGVQSCVTESKLLLCPSPQRGYVDITAYSYGGGIQHNERRRFQRFSPGQLTDCGVCASCLKVLVGKSGSVCACVGVEVRVCVFVSV